MSLGEASVIKILANRCWKLKIKVSASVDTLSAEEIDYKTIKKKKNHTCFQSILVDVFARSTHT